MVVSGKSGGPRVPAGTHAGRCISVIDLGTQSGGAFSAARKVYVGFELPEILIEDGEFRGQPRIMGMTMTASLGKRATLRKVLVSWRGQEFEEAELRGFDMTKLLGRTAMLNVIHKPSDNGLSSVIDSVVRIPKGLVVPPQVHKSTTLSLNQQGFTTTTYQQLPDWMREKIAASPEYRALFDHASENHGDGGVLFDHPPMDDDDLPF